jgi:hypothetical protein
MDAAAPRAPTFLVIGAAKSGTTSLHEYLRQHPDIFMSPVKEPNYFAFAGEPPRFRGPDDDGLRCRATPERLRIAKYARSVWQRADYDRLFSRAGRRRAIGESSVSYMYFPEAAARIHAALPDVRIIAMLRNPVDRAYSKFAQFVREGCEPVEDFGAALEAEDERSRRGWSPTWFYRRRGLYHEQLRRFYDRFDASRIRVFLYEDLNGQPGRVLRDIFTFLEIDPDFVPDTSHRHNVSRQPRREPRFRWPEALIDSHTVDVRLRRVFPTRAVDVLQRAARHANARYAPFEAPPLAPAVRARLTSDFHLDVQALGRLINRDLAAWVRGGQTGVRPGSDQGRTRG